MAEKWLISWMVLVTIFVVVHEIRHELMRRAIEDLLAHITAVSERKP